MQPIIYKINSKFSRSVSFLKELWNHTILLLIEKLWNNKFNLSI